MIGGPSIDSDEGYRPYASLLMTGLEHDRGYDYRFAQPANQQSYVIKGQDTDLFMNATAQNRGRGFKRVRFDQQLTHGSGPLATLPAPQPPQKDSAKKCIAPGELMDYEMKHTAVNEGKRLKNRILKQLAEES